MYLFAKRLKTFLLRAFNLESKLLIKYWQKRAQTYGVRAVYNLAHEETSLSDITKKQISYIFPLLKQYLSGEELIALDFGCGPGRFILELVQLVQKKVYGVEPINDFVKNAPLHERVEYLNNKKNSIPIDDKVVDLLFICLVLGGIREKDIEILTKEFDRILAPNAKICIVENISQKKDLNHWFYRSEKWYEQTFNKYNLKKVSEYLDTDEKVGIFIGVKR